MAACSRETARSHSTRTRFTARRASRRARTTTREGTGEAAGPALPIRPSGPFTSRAERGGEAMTRRLRLTLLAALALFVSTWSGPALARTPAASQRLVVLLRTHDA